MCQISEYLLSAKMPALDTINWYDGIGVSEIFKIPHAAQEDFQDKYLISFSSVCMCKCKAHNF